MASMPDAPDPGEADIQPDIGVPTSLADQVNNAVMQGQTATDIVAYHADIGADLPRPALADIWGPSGNNPSPFIDTGVDPHVDAINDGAGPIGEALIGAAAGGVVGIARGAAEGIAQGVLTDVSGELAPGAGRAAQLGVTTTTEELGTKVAGSAAIEGASAGDITKMVLGNKWTRRAGAAIAVGEGTFDVGKKSGKE